MFTLGDEEFGIDISLVQEIVRITKTTFLPNAPEYIEGVMNLRGDVIAVMDMGKRYGIGIRQRNEKSRIVITEIGESLIGLIVDSVKEVIKVDIENIEHPPKNATSEIKAELVEGIAKVEERLIVLLNLSVLLTKDEADVLDLMRSEEE